MSTPLDRLARAPKESRDQLLERLHAARVSTGDDVVEAPLSLYQEHLWILDRIGVGAAYNVPLCLRVHGYLDFDALRRAVAGLVARHEPLRTTFAVRHGIPHQRIHPSRDIDLHVFDFTPDGATAEALAFDRARDLAATPFDLERGPLLRAELIRFSELDALLVLVAAHIVFDGWSVGIALEELGELYAAARAKRPPSLPELESTYRHVVADQRAAVERHEGDLVEHWGRILESVEVLDLPTDRPRPVQASIDGGVVEHWSSADLAPALRSLGAANEATLYMVVLAGFAALLSRYTGASSVTVGSTTANRDASGAEALIGHFVNMLALRIDVSGDPGFVDLIARTRAVMLDALHHQSLPFSRVVEAVAPVRDPGRSPIFQVVLDTEPPIKQRVMLDDLAAEVTSIDYGISRFDLSVGFRVHPHAMCFAAEYNAELFEMRTIERLLAHFENVLRHAADQPETTVSRLRLLDDEERRRITCDRNRTERRTQERTIADAFSAAVCRFPDRIAVTCGDAELTYRELDERSSSIAHALRAEGVGPETVVGVLVERSVDEIGALLGVLKAGGAYVPLDPTYPPARLEFMLSDSAARLVLAHDSLRHALPEASLPLLSLDGAIGRAGEPPPLLARPQSLAYVIYTSGSTGIPKGVLIEQQAVTQFADAIGAAFSLTEDDAILHFASLNYDVSVFEIFGALTNGASVHVAREEERHSLEDLERLIRRRRITVTDLPPSLMHLLDSSSFEDLRIVFVGGEAFSSELVRSWSRPGRRFVNGYGPTESTVTMTLMDCTADRDPPPMGRPMRNHRAYVVDEAGNPVPDGVPGELVIAGAGLARGYLNRPALTAERFVPDPFGSAPGARLYRSGDRVRWLHDGNLEFLGRLDRQAKIRGFRVELGEIEAALLRHPAVVQAVVEPRGERAERTLVAYLTAASASRPTAPDLRSFLAEQLPPQMVPSAYIVLERLPMTQSGKIDRARLPEPTPVDITVEDAVAPRNELEEQIAAIVGSVLGLESPGVADNFFGLGGNSLQVTQVVARVREEFGVATSISEFYSSPTIATLAALVRAGMAQVPADRLTSALATIDVPSGDDERLLDDNGSTG